MSNDPELQDLFDAKIEPYRADPNYSGPPVVYDFEDEEVDPQPLLPGLRKSVGYPKRSFRKWKDDKGQTIEKAPRYRGAQFYAKLIPLPVDVHGKPLRIGSFQVMLHGSGCYVVADWSKPLGENIAYVSSKGLRDACIIAGMFHRWERWQGPLKKGQSRHKAVFGIEQRARPPAPLPPPLRELEADPVLSASEEDDTIDPLVRKLMWG